MLVCMNVCAYICVCMCVCRYICMCLWTHACGGHRTNVWCHSLSTIHLSLSFLLLQGHSLAWSSLCRLGRLVSELQESACLCSVSSGITSIPSWLFIVLHVGLGGQIQVFLLARQARYQLSHLPSPYGFLTKMHDWNFIRKGRETDQPKVKSVPWNLLDKHSSKCQGHERQRQSKELPQMKRD